MCTLRRIAFEEVTLVCFSQVRQFYVYQIVYLEPFSAGSPDDVVSEPYQCNLHFIPAFFRDRNDERAAPFSEQGNISSTSVSAGCHTFELALFVRGAKATGQRHLSDRNDLPATGYVVRRVEEPGTDHPAHQVCGLLSGAEVRPRRPTRDATVDYVQVLRAVERDRRSASDDHHQIPFALEAGRSVPIYIRQDPYHPDGGGREDGAPVGLVVEADVAAYDWRPEDLARLGHPLDTLGELVVAVGLLRAAEVEAVGDGDRLRPYTRKVPVGFGDRCGPAAPRVEVAVAAPAVRGGGEAAFRALYPHYRSVSAGQDHAVRAYLVVVLGEDGTPRLEVRMPQHLQEHGVVIFGLGKLVQVEFRYFVQVSRAHHVAFVDRSVGEVFGGDGAGYLSVLDHAQVAVVGDASYECSDELVAFRDPQNLIDLFGLDDGEHALLGLGDHDLGRLHPALAQGHAVGLDLDPNPAPRGHLGGRGGNAGGSEVLQRDQQVLIQQLQATLDEHLLAERVADLHVGSLRLRFIGELVRSERSPVYTVPPGLRAQQDNEVAFTGSARTDEILHPDKSYAHRVDQ